MKKSRKIVVKGIPVIVLSRDGNDYISLTDIARAKNPEEPKDVVKNWMRNISTVEFIGLWEKIHNSHFKGVEFDSLCRKAGRNSFTLSPEKWVALTNAVGIITKRGKGGGTFSHKDIAFEFATWISAEFKLYLITEFQRLKDEEMKRIETGWDAKRMLAKINYRIHTDAIKERLIPPEINSHVANIIYANEADVLNVALFGQTAKQWRDIHPKMEGNIRDYATVEQLVVLVNLESLNAQYIFEGVSQSERLIKLNTIAIYQMKALIGRPSIAKLQEHLNS